MTVHSEGKLRLLRSSREKLLKWIRGAMFDEDLAGEDLGKRCAEGVKWLARECEEAWEVQASTADNALYQYNRRKEIEGLLQSVLAGERVEEAEEYLRRQHYTMPGDRE